MAWKTIENKKGEIKQNPLKLLSKYKIFSNIVRSKQESSILAMLVFSAVIATVLKINMCGIIVLALISSLIPTILDIINGIISKKDGNIKTKRFVKTIDGLKASVYRGILDIGLIPDKAWITTKAETKTIYRMAKSKKHLLEWITSEEAERTAKTDVFSYYKNMSANTLFGILGIAVAILVQSLNVGIANFALIIGLYWLLTPALMCKISKANKEIKAVEK